jgi:hypothetical protein
MKSFKEFIKEQFMIARINMPQIDDVSKFTEWLTETKGVGSYPYIDSVNSFKPLQAEGFDEYKIKNICMGMRKDPDSIPNMKPIVVSEDGYVIDGHHRYLAAIREQVKIPYIVIDTTANKLLKLAYEYVETNTDYNSES